MSTHSRKNLLTQVVENRALIDGLGKHAASHPTFTVGGVVIQATDYVAVLQAANTSTRAVSAAKAAWTDAVQRAASQRAAANAMASGLKQALMAMYAGKHDVLADFGLKPRKEPTPRTAPEQVAAVAKGRATRLVRRTMGSKQKKAVKGNVVGVTFSPRGPSP